LRGGRNPFNVHSIVSFAAEDIPSLLLAHRPRRPIYIGADAYARPTAGICTHTRLVGVKNSRGVGLLDRLHRKDGLSQPGNRFPTNRDPEPLKFLGSRLYGVWHENLRVGGNLPRGAYSVGRFCMRFWLF
jgi:hypothetical protein